MNEIIHLDEFDEFPRQSQIEEAVELGISREQALTMSFEELERAIDAIEWARDDPEDFRRWINRNTPA